MDRAEPYRPTLIAFLKTVQECKKSKPKGNKISMKQLERPEVRDELTVMGAAVLSDN